MRDRVLLLIVAATALTLAYVPVLRGAETTHSVVAPDTSDDRLHTLTRTYSTLDVRDMDGRRWAAADLRGRVVVLDFWATWCPPCVAEIPSLRRLQHRFDGTQLQIIGISLDVTDRRTLIAWLNRYRPDWPQVWMSRGYDSPLAKQFGVTSLPTSILVAPDGRVVAVNVRGDRLMTAVEKLLAP